VHNQGGGKEVAEKDLAKYRQVEEGVRQWIKSHELRSGDRLPTEAKMADDFGVSRLTVRHAIGNLVHAGMLSRVQGRGTFYLGESSDVAPTKLIGVVVTYMNDYIFPSIIRGIQQCLDLEGYGLLLFSTGNDPNKERLAIKALADRHVDGLIVEPSRSMLPNANLTRFLALTEEGFPIVMVNAGYDGLSVPTVQVDDVRGGQLAANHLADLGHQRIGLIVKMDDKQGIRRMQGFLSAITERKIGFHAEWCQFFTTESKGVVADQYAQRIASLDPKERPTAVFCYNDEIAVNLISRLYTHHLRVPEDLSVVGYDDSDLARAVAMGLTTVIHPKAALGQRAAEMILARIGQQEIQDYVFSPTLIERGTTIARTPISITV
jgi:GntR family transcriptional regulator of arabinose operon